MYSFLKFRFLSQSFSFVHCFYLFIPWVVLGFEPRTLLVLDKASTTEVHSQPLFFSFVRGKVVCYVVIISFLCTVQNLGVWEGPEAPASPYCMLVKDGWGSTVV